jgi:hypothetical protein
MSIQLFFFSELTFEIIQFTGSHVECRYALATFGIPTKSVPVDENGTVLLSDFANFVEERKAKESLQKGSTNGDSIIECPGKFDVLLGRGRPFQQHTGNLRLGTILDMNQKLYETADHGSKWIVSAEIVKLVQASGGRFLSRADGETCWEEVEVEIAREKVAHRFRNRIRAKSTS